MKGLLLATIAFLLLSSLCAIQVNIRDDTNKYYLNSTLGFNISLRSQPGSEVLNWVHIKDGSATPASPQQSENSVLYAYTIQPINSNFIQMINLTLTAEKSNDGVRRYIKEFELTLTFDASSGVGNWSSDSTLTFVVRPPKFPHFQVKSDWKYSCPKNLSLSLCHVANGTSGCSQERPYSLVEVKMLLSDITFFGGKTPDHDYSSKIEECPLAYETRQDIGIVCIAAFWSVVLAVLIWGLVKFLVKRQRKRMD